MGHAGSQSIKDLPSKPELVLVSPNEPGAMTKFAAESRELEIPYLYDPSQQVLRLEDDELARDMEGAHFLFCNDYEFGLISKKTGWSLDQILEQLHELQAFDVHEAVDIFNAVIEALEKRPDEGRAKALDAVRVFSGDAAESRLLIRAACALCIADEDFSEAEQRQVAELCAELKIRPEDCDLEEIIRPR